MPPLLTVSNLSVRLGGRTVVENVSFTLDAGQTLVVLGPNGAGKTVLLRAILGLIPSTGAVSWGPGARPGYVPQEVSIHKDLPATIADFFALKGVSRAGAAQALSQVGVEEPAFLDRRLSVLSPGQFQRALIAWALIGGPQALFCDEPTSGIDAAGEETVSSLLRRLREKEKLAMILVTHDLSAVYGLADHALCLNKTPHCYGAPKEVLTPANLQALYGGELKFFPHSHG